MTAKKKYQQLYETLANEIASGKYAAGAKLPTEQDLMSQFGYSRQTIRQSLKALEAERKIERKQGSGSFVAHSGAAKKTMRIAVISKYVSNYVFPSLFRAIESVASSHSYSILLYVANNSIAKERTILKSLSSENVDGILVQGCKTALPSPNIRFYQELIKNNIPIVFYNGYYPQLFTNEMKNVVYTIADNYQAGYELTCHLISAGHHKIGSISKSDDLQGVRRYIGYADALTDHGIEYDDNYVLWFNTEDMQDLAAIFLNAPLFDECTAIICYNDQVALHLMDYLENGTYTVKALCSFDGTIINQKEHLDFFSLPYPTEAIGKLAAEKLFNILDGRQETNCMIPWELDRERL